MSKIYKINFYDYSILPQDNFLRHPDLYLQIDDEVINNWNTYTISAIMHRNELRLASVPANTPPTIIGIASSFREKSKLEINVHTLVEVPNIIHITPEIANTLKVSVQGRNYYLGAVVNYNAHLVGLYYKPYLKRDAEGSFWAPNSVVHKDFTKDYLKEQIRARYGFFDRPTNGLSNVVLDSFLPGLLYKYSLDIAQLKERETFPKTSVCISPLLADLLEIKRVPIDQLIRILGYTTQDIKELMTTVKNKQLDFIFAGVGGTGMNCAYWLDEMSKLTNTINIFNSIHIYEKENVEFSNTLRFPLPLSTYYKQGRKSKISIVMPLLSRLSSRKIQTHFNYITKGNYPWELFDYDDKANESTVIYGAPGLEFRNELSKLGNFVCATHASNSCSIWLNPTQTESIEVESYGMIQLGGFFMNQLRMTIGLLELLASDTPLNSQDTEFLNYTFDGTNRLRCDRVYNFQLRTDLLMMTEEQANNI